MARRRLRTRRHESPTSVAVPGSCSSSSPTSWVRVGSVVGIDRGDAEVETASKLIAERDMKQASVHRAEAWDTGIEPASIDVVNIRHVLAHNTTTTSSESSRTLSSSCVRVARCTRSTSISPCSGPIPTTMIFGTLTSDTGCTSSTRP